MRTLAITQNVSVDGRVDMLDDWFDPQTQSAELLDLNTAQQEACDTVLLGRDTFLAFRGYWRQRADDTTGVSAFLDGVDKHVVSSTLSDPEWENTTLVRDDPLHAARRLKEGAGGDIVVTGSVTLCHALFAAGLVDELRLFTYPVVQGRGRQVVGDDGAVSLRRLDVRALPGGVVYSAYAVDPAGDSPEVERPS